AERGIDVESLHDNWKGDPKLGGLVGVSLCDFDRDGILDILITDTNGTWLYKGLPGGRFRDVTDEVGLPRDRASLAAFIDIDGDGWDDLILPPSIYRNDRGKRFINVSALCNLQLPLDAGGVAIADFDRDGRLDLYLTTTGVGKADSWLEGKSGKRQG